MVLIQEEENQILNNMKTKVVKITSDEIEFDNGIKLYSEHESDCCEQHYLSFEDLNFNDFEDLEFDLTGDLFFNRIEDYGIELIPLNGRSVRIPGYGYNNGYYSSKLSLHLSNGRSFDISDCQVIND